MPSFDRISASGEARRIELTPSWSARWPYLLLLPVIGLVASALVIAGGPEAATPAALTAAGGAMVWLLGWSVIGARAVIVDSSGVEQRSLFGKKRIPWTAIAYYRYRPARARSGSIHAEDLLRFLDLLRPAMIHGVRPRLRLHGAGTTVTIDSAVYGSGGEPAIAHVLARLDGMIRDRIDVELAETGVATFGPLMLSRQAIAWGGRDPIAREQVESIELYDTQPVQLRVIARNKAWPYGRASVEHVPNALVALSIARRLGYPVPDRGAIAHPRVG